jgi:crossover junction endodeoxyribonuclease RuvC
VVILGVDPGTRHTGYGVIVVEHGRQRVVDLGVISPAAGTDHPKRLDDIYAGILGVIDRARPDQCAIEMPVYGQNAQAMLKLGRAQAAAMLAAMHRQVPVTEYTPAEVKKSVTGNGRASKEQVGFMIRALLELAAIERHDTTDALAVAICHAHRGEDRPGNRFKDWSSFVAANPGRVR